MTNIDKVLETLRFSAEWGEPIMLTPTDCALLLNKFDGADFVFV